MESESSIGSEEGGVRGFWNRRHTVELEQVEPLKFRNDEVNDTTDEEDMAQTLLETYSNDMQRALEGDYLTPAPRTMNFKNVAVSQDLQSTDNSDKSGLCSCSI